MKGAERLLWDWLVVPKLLGAVRKTFASSLARNSSNRESKAWDISGLMEARVRLRSSVPYLCLTRRGSPGWRSWSQVKTTKFSREGESSSSASGVAPWWVIPLAVVSKLSSTNDIRHW